LIPQQSSSGKIVLVLGGVRSGKSRFAQDLATEIAGDEVLFVATAEAHDSEMSRRIDLHRQSRPANWQTLERQLHIGAALAVENALPPVVLLDCLTLLVSNLLLQEEHNIDLVEQQVRAEVDALIQLIRKSQTCLIVVSGEVGMGVVPESSLGRHFRDLLGFANQMLAAIADATYFMIAGQAVNVTKLGSSVQDVARELGCIPSEASQ
jgi:adenosylcobinamide kinase / adenosylcobinamide-phosphate guanylyltransferase